MAIRVSASRQLPVPAEQAWAALTDWETQGRWMPATRISAEGAGVGTRLRAATGLGPLRVVDTMVVTEWEPPRRCVVRHTGRILRGYGIFTVEPVDADSCRVAWVEEFTVPSIVDRRPLTVVPGRLAQPFFGYALGRFERIGLRPGRASGGGAATR